jgi:hypothetical protein
MLLVVNLLYFKFQLDEAEALGEQDQPADSSVEDDELAGLMGAAPVVYAESSAPGGQRPPTRRSRRGGGSLSPLHSLPYSGRRF